MLWCLIGTAVMMTLLAVAALIARRPSLPTLQPWRLLRGCVAALFLALALALLGLALLLARHV